MRFVLVVLVLGGAAVAQEDGWTPAEGGDLIGRPAPEFLGLEWIQGGPLTVEGLRGEVVLIRFWLIGCPYCERSAPTLVDLDRRLAGRGLVVVGIHHPKSDASRDLEIVRRSMKEHGFEFAVAHDAEWRTLEKYWLTGARRRFTSVSFLIDKAGRIQFVHDGGEYHDGGGPTHEACRRARVALEAAIERALAG